MFAYAFCLLAQGMAFKIILSKIAVKLHSTIGEVALRILLALFTMLSLHSLAFGQGRELIQLANQPDLSPDGKWLAFEYAGDIWIVPTAGGIAKQLTQHSKKDSQPKFSPDGKEIAFISDRSGSNQIYIMPVDGGQQPRQITYHTGGYSLLGWYPDGQHLLASGSRDHYWRHADRFLMISTKERKNEVVLFDDYGANGQLSPDGTKLLFTREGHQWWRKGYHGSQASQIWMYDLKDHIFQPILRKDFDCRWPLWRPDGKAFYFVGGSVRNQNIFEYDLARQQERQLTQMPDDATVFPCLSRDGATMVFRHRFDFYEFRPMLGNPPRKIDIYHASDAFAEKVNRRTLQSATQVAFSKDGLEVAFIAGGDLWVMDTELREPKQITNTPEEERDPVFTPNGDGIMFVSQMKGQCDIWKATKKDSKLYWWQNDQFNLIQVTNDPEVESNILWSPEGSRFAFIKGRGDLYIQEANADTARKLFSSWSRCEYDWSPDGKWLVYAIEDQDFNSDIWIRPIDDSKPPYNLSRNPFNDRSPVWSPNGKMIAFVGNRDLQETDIFYVWLNPEDDEKSSRDRTLEKALEKMKKGPTAGSPGPSTPQSTSPTTTEPGTPRRRRPPESLASNLDDPPTKPQEPQKKTESKDQEPSKAAAPPKPSVPPVVIDFDRLFERVRRISTPQVSESNLIWSPDSKRLAFTATIEGKRGLYAIDLPDDPKAKPLSETIVSQAVWLKNGNQIVGLSSGLPTTLMSRVPGSLTPTSLRFTCLQTEDLPSKYQAAFDLSWQTMRDQFYDERLGNNDWNAIRQKYRAMASKVPDADSLAVVINMMLGELNGSHLGFFATGGVPRRPTPATEPEASTGKWTETTAHLGVRFDPTFSGPGLKIRDILPEGPADQKKSQLHAGEIILKIDGTEVHPTLDLTQVLNGNLARDILLTVKATDGKERTVSLRPISYTTARNLLYRKWLLDNQKMVEQMSNGKLGYLHISAMSMDTFFKFQDELFKIGHDKDGLIIDVRENGGGSTADHLLTALTQPVHAIAIPRGSTTPGYPQDRKIYASWNKPIVVLCNQNSFSNAEIFSHAVKTLKRGQLVGVPTAGGVISTGGTGIMDIGFIRLPFRGWYLINDGEDMELNGAVPHHVLWPEPEQLPKGKDIQLEKAIEVLQADVKAWQNRPQPKLRKSMERSGSGT